MQCFRKKIPHTLTILRMLLAVPAFFMVWRGALTAASMVLGVMILSDFLDGYWARKWDCVSISGYALDAVADFVCIAAYAGGFAMAGRLHPLSQIALLIGLMCWLQVLLSYLRNGKAKVLPHFRSAKVSVAGLILTYILIVLRVPGYNAVLVFVLMGTAFWTYRDYMRDVRLQ